VLTKDRRHRKGAVVHGDRQSTKVVQSHNFIGNLGNGIQGEVGFCFVYVLAAAITKLSCTVE